MPHNPFLLPLRPPLSPCPCCWQALLSSRGVTVASAALEAYVQWICDNYEGEMKRGNYLPNIAYDADGQFFSLM